MLELTPLEETTAVKEIIQITMDKGREEGLDKGELIGKIHLAQSLMMQPLTPREKLVEKSIDELSAILNTLDIRVGAEKELNKAELIGKIHMAQRLMGKPITPREKLVEQSADDLNAILDMLEPELNKVVSGSA